MFGHLCLNIIFLRLNQKTEMIIGIGGVSRAGKTSLAMLIQNWFGKDQVKILHQDDYIQPIDKMPNINGHTDWEHPLSYDFIGLQKAIKRERKHFKIIIVEGLLVFASGQLVKLFDKCMFLKINKETFLSRKTLDNRWGEEPDWYIEHIWNSHFIFGGIPYGLQNVLQLDGDAGFVDEIVQSYIKQEIK